MNDLEKYFHDNKGRLIHKWQHYFDIYETHFSRFRNKEVTILEIGVFHGGSLQMWKHYFGSKARIYGVDIDPRTKELEEDNITILIGSQSDRRFLRNLTKQIPPIDILIDDGGHKMKQQIITFEELFGHVKPDGVFLCEDLHTSYRLAYGGGHKRSGTFVEYSKNFIDYLHAFHSEQLSLPVSEFTKTVKGVHFYDSIVVIEKAKRQPPVDLVSGNPSFPLEPPERAGFVLRQIYAINKVLRFFRLPAFKLNK